MTPTRTRRWRLGILTAGVLVVAPIAAVLGLTGSAQAATCTPKVHETGVVINQTGSPVRVNFDFTPQCSDGTGRVSGTVFDILCDHRAAELTYTVYDWTGSSYRSLGGKTHSVPNGCNTSASFNDVVSSPGSVGWKFVVKIRACNSGGCSSSNPSGSLEYVG